MSVSADVRGLHLLRLLQLASPALPVGAYSYSQGLESAVAEGTVTDERSAAIWIEDVLTLVIAGYEGPLLLRMLDAASRACVAQLHALNATLLAGRETAELRAETVQMGRSLCRLLGELDDIDLATPTSSSRAPTSPGTGTSKSLGRSKALSLMSALPEPSFPCAWACAAAAFELSHEAAYLAYLWSFAENQVMAAVKLVPLGQSAGQRMLARLGPVIVQAAAARSCAEERLTNVAPGLAIASSRHETQYSRLFRS